MFTITERNLISEDTYKLMGELKQLVNKYVEVKKINRCKNCNREIYYTKYGEGQGYIRLGYCDLLCYEPHRPIPKQHFCINCNNETFAPINKHGHSTSVYLKNCKDCIAKGRHLNRGKRLKK